MKKTYIIPVSKVHNLQSAKMIATSPGMEQVDTNTQITDDNKDEYDFGQARGNNSSTNIWDNEW